MFHAVMNFLDKEINFSDKRYWKRKNQ